MADHPEADVRLPGGVSVGHWTDTQGRTGCTVVLVPDGAVAGVDVRGGAPGTLGTDELRPGTVTERAHAILLTGGSTFGLAAADGVMRYLDEHGVGFAIGTVRVPIVAGAVIFDLLTGDPRARPDAAAGYAACQAATAQPGGGRGRRRHRRDRRQGRRRAATPRWRGDRQRGRRRRDRRGGHGRQQRRRDLGRRAPRVGRAAGAAAGGGPEGAPGEGSAGPVAGANTTIGVVVTDAELTKEQANRVAAVAHDGIARAVRPAHTRYDGDTIFCLATGAVAPSGTAPVPVLADLVEVAAAETVARAIVQAVREGGRGA